MNSAAVCQRWLEYDNHLNRRKFSFQNAAARNARRIPFLWPASIIVCYGFRAKVDAGNLSKGARL